MFQSDVRLSRDRGITLMVTAIFRGAHAPARVNFGASPKFLKIKELVGEGADHSTRGACAPQTVRANATGDFAHAFDA
jgi:hypothetical protein